MDLPREDTLLRIATSEALDANTDLTLTAARRDGSDANLLLAGSAAMGGEVVSQLAAVAEGNFLDTATGLALDKVIYDRFNLLRKPASPAFVDVQFSTTAPAPAAFTVPSGSTLSTSDGKQLITIEDLAFPLGSTGPLSVRARTVLAGADQAVASGNVTSLVSQVALQPVDLRVTNALASAGSADRERDDDFRARARKFWRAFRGGVRGALEFGALAVAGVVKATAIEGIDNFGRGNRTVQLIVSDQYTDALVKQGVDVPSYDAQSQAFAIAVFNALDEWRAFGVAIDVFVAQVVLVPITLRLRFRAGADTSLATIMARALSVDAVNNLRPGDSLDPALIIQRLKIVPGLDVRGDEVENPPGVVLPQSPYQVLRSTLAITIVSTQVTS